MVDVTKCWKVSSNPLNHEKMDCWGWREKEKVTLTFSSEAKAKVFIRWLNESRWSWRFAKRKTKHTRAYWAKKKLEYAVRRLEEEA